MAYEGEYDAVHIPITSDVCGIVDRLKEIDEGYFVMFNRVSGKFEVHHSGQFHDTLACELPFNQLDDRAVQRVRETSIANADRIFRELLLQDEILMNMSI
jgi:hypothetical protein